MITKVYQETFLHGLPHATLSAEKFLADPKIIDFHYYSAWAN